MVGVWIEPVTAQVMMTFRGMVLAWSVGAARRWFRGGSLVIILQADS
jgi:hypothetical protein